MSPFSNKWVIGGIAVTVALHLLLIYVLPHIGFNPFRVEAFPAQWWALVVLLEIPVFFLVELEDFLVARKRRLAVDKSVGHSIC